MSTPWTALMAVAVIAALTGCAPGATATIANDCAYPAQVYLNEASSHSVNVPFDLEVYRESAHIKTLATGTKIDFAVSPGSPKTVMVIVYGADSAKVDYFGDQLTGSLDYTIRGVMCLTPAEDVTN